MKMARLHNDRCKAGVDSEGIVHATAVIVSSTSGAQSAGVGDRAGIPTSEFSHGACGILRALPGVHHP
jgi:hypothetical protein